MSNINSKNKQWLILFSVVNIMLDNTLVANFRDCYLLSYFLRYSVEVFNCSNIFIS